MKYIAILLMLGGVVKGQTSKGGAWNITDSGKVTIGSAIYYGNGVLVDSCTLYRDSLNKYKTSIQMWQRRISPQ